MEHENPECQISSVFPLPPCEENFAQTKRAAGKTNLTILNKIRKH